ncbi:hypothetical protein BZL30_2018 [Mycobacterium kansasii]|uniref:Uncharacterized protein n=1 Tax=Mycobacterium kansasii TaxID=1768 RepID=A0A1V3XHJ4_MYCKA|nr:hypothetical protein BZL30_2018 [Mycobacterium kansasii]OOK81026.1 hypothetical protein BZL29_2045 [Mycobacterium kansasii]
MEGGNIRAIGPPRRHTRHRQRALGVTPHHAPNNTSRDFHLPIPGRGPRRL